MNRAITFTPAARSSATTQDLHYFEQGSRHRSIHALFQDCGPQRSAARALFLQKAYREVVSRFVGFGKIEHPLPFLRELTRTFDRLSRGLDCRVDDFRGLGIYVLIQDGSTFYLLASREGQVSLDFGDGLAPLAESTRDHVTELPVDVSTAQKELFAVSTRDHLVLYRITVTPPEVDAREGRETLRALVGGREGDHGAALEAVREPRWDAGLERGGATAREMVANTVLWVSFTSAATVRDPLLDAMRSGRAVSSGRVIRAVATTAVVLTVAVSGALWFSERSARTVDMAADDAAPSEAVEVSASQDASSRLKTSTEEPRERVAEMIAAGDTGADAGASPHIPADDPAAGVKMAVEWRKVYDEPVTTSPALDGDRVYFGSRGGKVYSLDANSGEVEWSYTADKGVGASPVVAGDALVGADYEGNVFRLDKKTGKPAWKRALGAKVVSTPCVSGGEVLVGCTDGVGYGLSLETGRVLWRVKTGGRIRASAVAAAGRFYLPSYDGKLYAVTQGTGAPAWTFTVGGNLTSSPAADGSRVVIGGDSGVYAADVATGKRLWFSRTPAPVKSFIHLEGGRVFAGCNDGNVYCLDAATGSRVWTASTGETVLSRPRLVGELLFVTSYDKYVYCFDADTGGRIDRLETAGSIYSSPAIAGDRVFFGNNQGEFYCINYRSQRSR